MEQILQTIDVAARLGCSVELVRLMARNGRLRSEQTPRGTRIYRAEDVEALRIERERKAASAAANSN